jgi:hypothetical protein
VEEVIRACLAREVSQGAEVERRCRPGPLGLRRVVFVLGETVPAGIVEQVGATDLAAEMAGEAPVLLVQMGRNDRMRPDIDKAGWRWPNAAWRCRCCRWWDGRPGG